ncbi:uncharacterized protein BYT42DRAFT_609025 [Radiomyces spectabilis]|uniref:uncharacterized protein n=1 Tax=Radiomyces spectabilis TaxID=64574 RepID=UPI002220E60E|nr:uncharacterized protein BYT42DRAFT_609025 [Radiomyces spectabilis]KAI8364371.1 hypothetical protein BYT42DRAFT_609025 [Radiomyces spectabilis]
MLFFLRRDPEKLQIVDFYKHSNMQCRQIAEKEFRTQIESIIVQKHLKNRRRLVEWAKKIKNDNFQILRSTSAEHYWTQLKEKEVQPLVVPEQVRLPFRSEVSDVILKKASKKRTAQQAQIEAGGVRRSPRLQKKIELLKVDEHDEEVVEIEKAQAQNSKNATRNFFWLPGPGVIQEISNPDKKDDEWLIGEVNLSKTLHKHHNDVVNKCQEVDLSDPAEILGLNYIFLFPLNKKCGIWPSIPNELQKDVIVQINIDEGRSDLPWEAIEAVRAINKATRSRDNVQRGILSIMQSFLDKPQLEPFGNCLFTLVNNYQGDRSSEQEEWQFAECTLMPYLRAIFPANEDFQISGPTRSSKAAKFFYSMADTTLIAPKPDVVISKNDMEFLAGEFKCPNKKCVGVYNDLVKLGNELKFMLDAIIYDGADEAALVVGILLEGVKCRTYKLDLDYNGVYRLIELSCSDLMTSDFDFYPAISIFENIAQLKNLIIKSPQRKQPFSWLRKSFLPPCDVRI